MEQATTKKQRLHPLLTAAAVSVTLFSAAGIGAMTGLLPISHSSTPQSTPELVSKAPAAPTPPIGPEAVKESAPQATEMPPAAPAQTPVKKPVHKKIAKAKPKPAPQPVQVAEAAQAQGAPVPPPPPAAIEAPKPVPGVLGVVESVREVSTPAEKSNGAGPIAGGVAGAVLGHQFGNGGTNTILTVLGAAGGALAGREIEKNVRATKHWEIVVRLDDGSTRTLKSDTAPYWHGGERVRLLDGRLQPA